MKRPAFFHRDVVQRIARLGIALILIGACFAAEMADAATEQAKPAAAAKSRQGARYVASCSWDHPGLRPFMGDVVAAVDRYRDIPQDVRARLKERMAVRQYDDFVAIERDAIVGDRLYEPGIRDMHFGDNRVCGVITRTKWTPAMRERGLVYCEGEHCIVVPTVCRNVSRIKRRRVADEPAPRAPAGGVPGGAPAVPESAPPALPGEGGYALYGWLTVEARRAEEPGLVSRPCPCLAQATPFMPPYSGGPIWTGPVPVPEAPGWMMFGAGALVVLGAARRKARKAPTR